MKKNQLARLKKENIALRETCEILADKKILKTISISLKQIQQGKWIPLSKL